jgi:hypothetical protein
MYCPNCGNKNSTEQRFCRSCGLGLEKIAQSLTEQLPTQLDESLHERKERLERWGVAALSVFGVGVLSFLLYGIFYKLMITQGKVLAGLAVLAFTIIMGCGLVSAILFAMAKETKEAGARRLAKEPAELSPGAGTQELLPEAHTEPVFSVAERTTDLLYAETKSVEKES